jgi:hypothetical protein
MNADSAGVRTSSDREDPSTGVSIVMPVLNEAKYLDASVRRLLNQSYTGPIEVILALGPSRDETNDVANVLRQSDARVILVDNPSGRTPTGLNKAIEASHYSYVVRCDGHAEVPSNYVATAIETLERTGADNVGGIMAAQGITPFEQAVSRAMTTPLGVGGASFHIGGEEGPAPTVYLGAFRRSALDRVQGYDESMVRAQDWEMNLRIRETGGVVWFTPKMRVTYRPRGTIKALAKQYFEYGRWRREVVRRHPDTISARYLAAPVAVAGVGAGTLLGLVAAVGGPSWCAVGWCAPLGYLALIVGGSAVVGRGLPLSAWVRLPAVLATMHGSWGLGFLLGRSAR